MSYVASMVVADLLTFEKFVAGSLETFGFLLFFFGVFAGLW